MNGRVGGCLGRRLPLGFLLACVVGFLVSPSRAEGHPASLPSASLVVRQDGTYSLTVRVDVLAFALNDTVHRVSDDAMHALLNGPAEELDEALAKARGRFAKDFVLDTAQGPAGIETLEMPTAAEVWQAGGGRADARLPIMADIRAAGRLPAEPRSVAVRFPKVLGAIVLVVEAPGQAAAGQPVGEGEYSVPVEVSGVAPHVTTRPLSDDASTLPSSQAVQPSTPSDTPQAGHPGWFGSARGYVVMGFTHIFPEGVDHMLFVLGLFLLNARLRPLLWQVTAFTVAHSVTLALSLYGVITLPERLVETLIAASIAFIAIENLFTSKLHAWRPVLVFVFGLIHGLGFAAALRELELPRQDFAPALIGFNAGVELGQLCVVALAFATVGWFRHKRWYRAGIVLPLSAAIAVTAVVWTVQRMSGA